MNEGQNYENILSFSVEEKIPFSEPAHSYIKFFAGSLWLNNTTKVMYDLKNLTYDDGIIYSIDDEMKSLSNLQKELQWAFLVHIYGFACLFFMLAFYTFFSILNLRSQISNRPYMSTINVFLCLLGVSRAACFLIDPYCSRKVIPEVLGSALWDVGYPCIISAFSLVQLAFSQLTQMKLRPERLRRKSYVSLIITAHFSLVLGADIVKAFEDYLQVVWCSVQTLSLAWGLILCLTFMYGGARVLRLLKTIPNSAFQGGDSSATEGKGILQLALLSQCNNIASSVLTAAAPSIVRAPKIRITDENDHTYSYVSEGSRLPSLLPTDADMVPSSSSRRSSSSRSNSFAAASSSDPQCSLMSHLPSTSGLRSGRALSYDDIQEEAERESLREAAEPLDPFAPSSSSSSSFYTPAAKTRVDRTTPSTSTFSNSSTSKSTSITSSTSSSGKKSETEGNEVSGRDRKLSSRDMPRLESFDKEDDVFEDENETKGPASVKEQPERSEKEPKGKGRKRDEVSSETGEREKEFGGRDCSRRGSARELSVSSGTPTKRKKSLTWCDENGDVTSSAGTIETVKSVASPTTPTSPKSQHHSTQQDPTSRRGSHVSRKSLKGGETPANALYLKGDGTSSRRSSNIHEYSSSSSSIKRNYHQEHRKGSYQESHLYYQHYGGGISSRKASTGSISSLRKNSQSWDVPGRRGSHNLGTGSSRRNSRKCSDTHLHEAEAETLLRSNSHHGQQNHRQEGADRSQDVTLTSILNHIAYVNQTAMASKIGSKIKESRKTQVQQVLFVTYVTAGLGTALSVALVYGLYGPLSMASAQMGVVAGWAWFAFESGCRFLEFFMACAMANITRQPVTRHSQYAYTLRMKQHRNSLYM
ncbi:uncharacterized protein LOC143020751 [Oratosquilla oratoria]|uniref:uncharacterized protein LOC143020751 n=1 Tax=Oratosquilla oratoria TaxID=337810 RepID=UPI003F777931